MDYKHRMLYTHGIPCISPDMSRTFSEPLYRRPVSRMPMDLLWHLSFPPYREEAIFIGDFNILVFWWVLLVKFWSTHGARMSSALTEAMLSALDDPPTSTKRSSNC